MTPSLEELESRRAALLDQIQRLGDLRPGSITATTGRCGNPRCHCQQPGPERPWTQRPVDLPPPGQDRHRVLPQPGGPTKSTARDR